jgi:hypothetical protein
MRRIAVGRLYEFVLRIWGPAWAPIARDVRSLGWTPFFDSFRPGIS